ncbi:MAG: ferrous iron transporter B, partial [Paludibacteraceae bacterium]|nr:ferrous iron transporter B [Paludibacteraceae bacterium]
SARNTLIHMWEKSVQYLKKMGSVILVASIIIWALCYFPTHNSETDQIDAQIAQTEENIMLSAEQKEEKIAQLELDRAVAHSENSYIGTLGKFIEPVVRPLGFNWKMGVSILSGAAAKEIVVSSLGVLYHADLNADEESEDLKYALQMHRNDTELPITPLVAFGFMVFVLLYFPCVAAITAIAKEAGWKWAGFNILYTTTIAWIVSFLIYQIGSLF